MATRAEATAAPTVVELGGKKYKLKPLRDRDLGEFEQWVQDRYLQTVKRNLADLDGADRDRLLDRAFDRAATITASSPEALKLMTSVEGATKLLWFGLRQEQPNITEEEVSSLIAEPGAFDAATEALDRVNGRAAEPLKKGKSRQRGGRNRRRRNRKRQRNRRTGS